MTIPNEYLILFGYHVIAYFSLIMNTSGGVGIGALLVPLCWVTAILHVLFRFLRAIYGSFAGPATQRGFYWRRFGGVLGGALLLNAAGFGLAMLAS